MSEIIELATWEGSKENVQPRRKGRDPRALRAFGQDAKATLRDQNKETSDSFEEKIKNYAGQDPLQTWVEYMDWLDQAYPSGCLSTLLPLLERCTRTFKDNPLYTNDERYLKVWCLYADKVDDPRDIFTFVETNGIGLDHALLYERWAAMLEDRKDVPGANQVYEKGLNRNAEPRARLLQRQQEFQLRAFRRMTTETDEPEPEPEAEQRHALGRVSQAAPGARTMLSRAGTMKQDKDAMAASQGAKQNAGFEVFRDENGHAASAKPGAWKDLAGDRERQKENTVAATKWAGATVSQAAVAPALPLVKRKEEKFSIFADPEAEDDDARAALEPEKPRKTLRAQLEDDTEEVKELRANPLRNFLPPAPAHEAAPAARAPALVVRENGATTKAPAARAPAAAASGRPAAGIVAAKPAPKEKAAVGLSTLTGKGKVMIAKPPAPAPKATASTATAKPKDRKDGATEEKEAGNVVMHANEARLMEDGVEISFEEIRARAYVRSKMPELRSPRVVRPAGTPAAVKMNAALFAAETLAAPLAPSPPRELTQELFGKSDGFGGGSGPESSGVVAGGRNGAKFAIFDDTLAPTAGKPPRIPVGRGMAPKTTLLIVNDENSAVGATAAPWNPSNNSNSNVVPSQLPPHVAFAEEDFVVSPDEAFDDGAFLEGPALLPEDHAATPPRIPAAPRPKHVRSGTPPTPHTSPTRRVINFAPTSARSNSNSPLVRMGPLNTPASPHPLPLLPDVPLEPERVWAQDHTSDAPDENQENLPEADTVMPLVAARCIASSAAQASVFRELGTAEYFARSFGGHLEGETDVSLGASLRSTAPAVLHDSSLIERSYESTQSLAPKVLFGGEGSVVEDARDTAANVAEEVAIAAAEVDRSFPDAWRFEIIADASHQPSAQAQRFATPSTAGLRSILKRTDISASLSPLEPKGLFTGATPLGNSVPITPRTTTHATPSATGPALTTPVERERTRSISPLMSGTPAGRVLASSIRGHGVSEVDPYCAAQLAWSAERAASELSGMACYSDCTCDLSPMVSHFEFRDGVACAGQNLELQVGNQTLLVDRLLGTSPSSAVFSVEDANAWDLAQASCVLKVSRPCSAWEFYVAMQLRERLREDDRLRDKAVYFVKPLSVYAYQDAAITLFEQCKGKTLQDAINVHQKDGRLMDEALVMFYAMELLKAVEALLCVGIIHGDVTASNVLLRSDAENKAAHWQPNGGGGWDAKGIKLVDFSHSIDTRLYPEGTMFSTMREGTLLDPARPWKYQMDTFAACDLVHVMLFGTPLAISRDVSGRTIPMPPRRARDVSKVWGSVWEGLLNPPPAACENNEECAKWLRQLRSSLEKWLCTHLSQAQSIKTLLCKQDIMLYE